MSKVDSIKALLRNLAIRNGKPFEYVLTHYFIERVLYRLSVSPYAAHFVLKSGLLLQAVLEQSGIRDGMMLVSASHITASSSRSWGNRP